MLERIDKLSSRAEKAPASHKELTFLASIRTQWIRKGSLSHSQQSWLESLEEKYSIQAIQEQEVWKKNFTDAHRSIAIQMAHYYKANPPYFETYVHKIFENPSSFFLTRKEWDKFCENKYAKKIRKEYEAEPKFNKNQTVEIRKTNKITQANYNRGLPPLQPLWAGKVGFVLDVSCRPIVRAARGSKIYKILLTGQPAPIFAHESDLKNHRGTKK